LQSGHAVQAGGLVHDHGLGEHRAAGVGRRPRSIWVVVEPVAHAVDVLQRLHPHRLLFPAELNAFGDIDSSKTMGALSNGLIAGDIASLIEWVNRYCDTHDCVSERIPNDPRGKINLSRFRRILSA
jgi:hypothetical protein